MTASKATSSSKKSVQAILRTLVEVTNKLESEADRAAMLEVLGRLEAGGGGKQQPQHPPIIMENHGGDGSGSSSRSSESSSCYDRRIDNAIKRGETAADDDDDDTDSSDGSSHSSRVETTTTTTTQVPFLAGRIGGLACKVFWLCLVFRICCGAKIPSQKLRTQSGQHRMMEGRRASGMRATLVALAPFALEILRARCHQ